MPKVVRRFQIFFAIIILLQAVIALPGFATQPAYAAGKLFGCLLWTGLAFATLRGSEGTRKFIVFMSYLGAGGAALGTLGGFLVAIESMSPVGIFLVVGSLVSFFLNIGVAISASDDVFRKWVVSKAMQRASAKLAVA